MKPDARKRMLRLAGAGVVALVITWLGAQCVGVVDRVLQPIASDALSAGWENLEESAAEEAQPLDDFIFPRDEE